MLDQLIEQAKNTLNGLLNQFRSQFMQDIVAQKEQLKKEYAEALTKIQQLAEERVTAKVNEAKEKIYQEIKDKKDELETTLSGTKSEILMYATNIKEISQKTISVLNDELQKFKKESEETVARTREQFSSMMINEIDKEFVKLFEKNEEILGKIIWKSLIGYIFKSFKKSSQDNA